MLEIFILLGIIAGTIQVIKIFTHSKKITSTKKQYSKSYQDWTTREPRTTRALPETQYSKNYQDWTTRELRTTRALPETQYSKSYQDWTTRELQTFKPTQIYYKNQSILTENERIFYKILSSIISLEDHIILCKIRMEDVIHVDLKLQAKNPEKFKKARFNIANRHFDFVICDIDTLEIQRVIELDGWTHKKEKEAKADYLKNEICKEAGIKLVRIDYNEMNFKDKIIEKILNA